MQSTGCQVFNGAVRVMSNAWPDDSLGGGYLMHGDGTHSDMQAANNGMTYGCPLPSDKYRFIDQSVSKNKTQRGKDGRKAKADKIKQAKEVKPRRNCLHPDTPIQMPDIW